MASWKTSDLFCQDSEISSSLWGKSKTSLPKRVCTSTWCHSTTQTRPPGPLSLSSSTTPGIQWPEPTLCFIQWRLQSEWEGEISSFLRVVFNGIEEIRQGPSGEMCGLQVEVLPMELWGERKNVRVGTRVRWSRNLSILWQCSKTPTLWRWSNQPISRSSNSKKQRRDIDLDSLV